MYINNLTYSYRMKTKAVLQNQAVKYFDVYIINDPNFE
jgi:hypothetical protein